MKNLTLGILAHVDAGKTTLAESILYDCGTIRQMGRVDKRDTFLDTDVMERERGITIFSKQAVFELNRQTCISAADGDGDVRVTMLDTPGHVDFSPEAERTLWVLDGAVLVVSAPEGVQGHTRTLFKLLSRHGIPTIIFINKLDQAGMSGEDRINELLSELKSELSEGCIPENMFYDDSAAEDIAVLSESLMEKYLDEGKISKDDIMNLVSEGKLFPVYMGSALKNQGVSELIKGISEYFGDLCVKPDAESEGFSAKIFKISRDEEGNRLTHVKVTGGCCHVRDIIDDEKVTAIRRYNGTKFENLKETETGGVYALLGLNNTCGGNGMGAAAAAPLAVLEPLMVYSLYPPAEVQDTKMLQLLNELCEDMPEFSAVWDEEHGEIHVSIMGDVQLEILKRIIKDRFNITVSFGPGKILYKETIASVVEGVGHFEPLRHYAEVHLKMEPAGNGTGIVVENEADTDFLALNWQRLIMTHLLEKTHRGVLTGAPLTDVKITVLSGRAHPKHTMGGDFRQATYRAVRQGLMQAKNVLLEPYYKFTLRVPEKYVGRAMTDMERIKAKFEGPTPSENGYYVLTGTAPVVLLQDYPSQLSAYAAGMGSISYENGGFGICHNPEEVLLEKHYDPAMDMRNPVDSVFCYHGSAEIIPWDKVPEHMHVPYSLSFDANGELIGKVYVDDEEELLKAAKRSERSALSSGREREFIGYEEVDAIVNAASGANIKTGKRLYKKQKAESFAAHKRVRSYKGREKLKSYILVDGYNVIHAVKELSELCGDNLDAARGRLLDMLSNYQAMKQSELIAVFDAYRVKGGFREMEDYHNIHVVYTKTAETADAYIERFAHENADKYDITVITSDGLEQIIITGEGCRLISSREFDEEYKALSHELAQKHMDIPSERMTFLDQVSKDARDILEGAFLESEQM